MSVVHFKEILRKSLDCYWKKTISFNDKPTVLFCRESEKTFFEKFSCQFKVRFDKMLCNFSLENFFEILDNNKNYFFSNHIMTDKLYKSLVNAGINCDNIYIGPTKNAYFDLYQKRNIIHENIESINTVYYLLEDDKSRRIFLQIITRLCLPYQFHYFYEPDDDPQYFPKEFDFDKDEVFLDAGVCDGQNIFEFIEYVQGHYKYIYGIEADENNFNLSKDNLSGIERLELVKGALFSQKGEQLNFRSSQMTGRRGNPHIQTDGDIIVSTINGDSLRYTPTFIKMDIEGSEKEALTGLEKTIKSHGPKLAICIYHFQKDFWELPLLIKRLNPKYKLMIRNHERLFTLLESVCYAYV